MSRLFTLFCFIFISQFLHAQINVVKFSSAKGYKIEDPIILGRSVAETVWSIGDVHIKSNAVSINFDTIVTGIVINGIGQISNSDNPVYSELKIKIEAINENGNIVTPVLGFENMDDEILWDSTLNEITVNRSVSSSIHLFFKTPITIINFSDLSESINLRTVNIEAFYEGESPLNIPVSDVAIPNCDSIHTSFIVDISYSIDDNDLTYISSQIINWVSEQIVADTSTSGHLFSLVGFAGQSREIYNKSTFQDVSFNSIYNGLKNAQLDLPSHTNWIAGLDAALGLAADRNIFILDGWHNGKRKLNDSLSNDIYEIVEKSTQLRGISKNFCIAIDKLALENNSEILKIISGVIDESEYEPVLADAYEEGWISALNQVFSDCQQYNLGLKVKNENHYTHELIWDDLLNSDNIYEIYRKSRLSGWVKLETFTYSSKNGVCTGKDSFLEPGLYTYKVVAKSSIINLESNEVMGYIPGIVSCYPNPADNFILVKVKLENPNKDLLRITDIIGREYQLPIDISGKNTWQINTESLVPGSYIIHYMDRQQNMSHRVKFVIL